MHPKNKQLELNKKNDKNERPQGGSPEAKKSAATRKILQMLSASAVPAPKRVPGPKKLDIEVEAES